MSNIKKAATLGMPHGTATHRLRKNVLFHLLKKHGENYCFKCSEQIEVTEDLSIEHKKPWEGISADLFWDLENIAFSHLRCNRPESNNAQIFRKIGPTGTSWCYKCGFKPVSEFAADSNNWSGYDRQCKDCKNRRNALRNRK